MKSIVESRLDGKALLEVARVPWNGPERGSVCGDDGMLLATQGAGARELSATNPTVASCGFALGNLVN